MAFRGKTLFRVMIMNRKETHLEDILIFLFDVRDIEIVGRSK